MLSLIMLILQAVSMSPFAWMGAAFGVGISAIGASVGIGQVGMGAMNAISRHPESVADIRANMIIASGLIEGACFFAMIVCLLIVFLVK